MVLEYRLSHKTLQLAANYIDRYLCLCPGTKKSALQLVGVTGEQRRERGRKEREKKEKRKKRKKKKKKKKSVSLTSPSPLSAAGGEQV